MAEYRRGAHTLYDIEYHFVWVTKYRYHILKGAVGLRTRELIRQTCLSREIKIIKGHVSKDHVHVLLSCPPKLSPAQIMQYLKGRSSRKLQQEFPHLKKRYWGQHIWARGYFCASIGAMSKEQIKAYIEQHDKEPMEGNFSVEDEQA